MREGETIAQNHAGRAESAGILYSLVLSAGATWASERNQAAKERVAGIAREAAKQSARHSDGCATRKTMSIFEKIKAAIARALGRAAKKGAEHQAEGMAEEARGIVAGAKSMARTNPLGLGILVALGAGLLWLSLRRKQDQRIS